MSSEEERARRFVERHFPEVAGFLAAERGEGLVPTFGPTGLEMVDEPGEQAAAEPEQLPVYGPSEVFDDEGVTPHVVVRVAVALSREQLVTALAIGVTNLGADTDPEQMTADEVRREIEGYFAAVGLVEIDTLIDEGWPRSFPPAAQLRMDAIAAAVERAYPAVAR